ncbi:MAG: phosphodiester glycosidase family protein [Planctomycetaceae bacterium]|nr:phosphodiester glycosidase family protein [Planctomycetaceae bacterium]
MTVTRRSSAPRLWLRLADGMAVVVILVTFGLSVDAMWSRPQRQPRSSVRPGIATEFRAESVGFVHLVTVDLRSPAVSVELAPVSEPNTEFRLVWLPTLLKQSGWVVAISGGDFSTPWGRYAPAGNIGRPLGTLICEGRTVQRRAGGALLWFDEYQTGHLEMASDDSHAWTAARWGLGGPRLCVTDGVANAPPDGDRRGRRTVVGLDRSGCMLTLATFESATVAESAEWLAAQGIWRAMELGTAENAGIVIDTAGSPVRATTGPQRFIVHALGIRSTSTSEPAAPSVRRR